ncbi:hypothetical protein C6N19_06530 [Acinetobacter pittii]|uniref:NosD domain-containing protein n=1 Tax=Acinetobacter pittii TaxID=48296 RepID=UPI000D08A4CA|nr:NosD domain-containing protein [Acinetobacter pittii]AVN17619.1 hypothetical protein C6N19_06530 [Acinetobacter pittii]RZH38547.1 hypothetical protein EXD94_15400 [Acinetobacter pittii]
MTVPVSDRLSQLYVGNGVNTRFDFSFRIFDQEDETGIAIRVKVGNEFEFMDEALYASTVNQDGMGGYITFTTPPNSSTFFYICGNTPVDQLLDITNYDNFYPDAIERALDKLTAVLQEWKHLIDFEAQSRILADIDYDELALKREAELKDFLMEEIRKQGVALDQLDDYYNYLMDRLAQIAIDNNWDASFISYGGINQNKFNDGFESIEEMLQIQNPKHNMRVPVKSYYSGANKGGDDFYYDSTKAGINNGVTIFNGWCRDLSDKILTTDDAGLLGDGLDSDVTNRLRTFAQLSSRNGFTVQIIGTYYPAKNIVFSNAVDLKLIGINTKIEADRSNWTFDGTKRGVIYANDCPSIVVSNLKGVKGVTLTNYNIALGEARMQDGDAGIQLVRCNNNVVMHNKVSNVKTWGILTEASSNSTIIHNEVFKCLRQSGVNAIVNSSSEKAVIAHNTIYECGLYGIELETQISSKGKHLIHDNIIYNCQVGISCVGKVFDTSIHDNMITDCYQGFLTVNVNKTATKGERLRIYDNTVLRCAYGYRYSGTWYTDFVDNTLDGANVPAYGLTSPYHAVEELIDSTSFKSIRDFEVGSTIFINDVAYTVTASSSAPDTQFGAKTVYTITVNNTLTGVQNGDAIKVPMTVQRGIDAWYLENRYTNIERNTVRNYPSGYYSQPTMVTGAGNTVAKNRFIDCTNAINSPTDTQGVSYLNNEYVRCTNNPIHINQIIRNQTSIKWFYVENPVAITAAGTKWTINFNVEDDLFYQAVDIYVFNSATSSGTIVIKLDGVDLTQRAISASGTVNALNNLSGIQKLTRGAYTLQIVDTTGSFACAYWRIGFKCI